MPAPKLRVSVMLTSYNRHTQTMQCLRSLHDQAGDHALRVILVDDNSTDGTPRMVEANFPEVEVIPGTGHLFWGGGMRLAHQEASKHEYDFLLWLNDDVILFPSALTHLLQTYFSVSSELGHRLLIVGALKDPYENVTTYSGLSRGPRWRPLRFRMLEPDTRPTECDTMNGNLVLIPKPVADLIGSVDEAFPHAIGDIDYGLRARRAGCQVILAPSYKGLCSRHAIEGTHLDPSLSARTHLKLLGSLKVIPPRSWATFARRYGGPLWPFFWVSPYVRVVIAGVVDSTRRLFLRKS